MAKYKLTTLVIASCFFLSISGDVTVRTQGSVSAQVGGSVILSISVGPISDLKRVDWVNTQKRTVEKYFDPLPPGLVMAYDPRYTIVSDVTDGNYQNTTEKLENITACDNGEHYYKVVYSSLNVEKDYTFQFTVDDENRPSIEIVKYTDDDAESFNFNCMLSDINFGKQEWVDNVPSRKILSDTGVKGLKWHKKNAAGETVAFESNEQPGSVVLVHHPDPVCRTNASVWLNVTTWASSTVEEFYYECSTPDERTARTKTFKVPEVVPSSSVSGMGLSGTTLGSTHESTKPSSEDITTTGQPVITSGAPSVTTTGSDHLMTDQSTGGVSSATSEVATVMTSRKGLSGTTLGEDITTTGLPVTTSGAPSVTTPGSDPLTTDQSSSGVSSATSEVATVMTSGKGLSGTSLGEDVTTTALPVITSGVPLVSTSVSDPVATDLSPGGGVPSATSEVATLMSSSSASGTVSPKPRGEAGGGASTLKAMPIIHATVAVSVMVRMIAIN